MIEEPVILRKRNRYKSKLNRYSLNIFSKGHEKSRIMKLSKSRDQINKGNTFIFYDSYMPVR